VSVKVVTDSTSYLPAAERERHDVTMVPLHVHLEGAEFSDASPDHASFYAALAATKAFPTTSQPAVSDLVEIFEARVAEGHDVVGVFISSEMSGTFSTAELARGMVLERHPDARIALVDSRSNCMELGLAALAAAETATAGGDVDAVVGAAGERIERTRFLFVPETLEYLRRGGRIGGASALLGSLLQIRPILTVVDGVTDVFAKVRTVKRALAEIVSAVERDAATKGGVRGLLVHHIDAEEQGRALAEELAHHVDAAVSLVSVGPAIGAHVGPGTVGVVYHTAEPMRKTER